MDGDALPADDLTGRDLAGYRVERLLGRGAVGSAWMARGPDGPVVLKVLEAVDPGLRRRFARESAALARVADPHVVRVLAVHDEPRPFFVMEHLAGPSLRGLLQRVGPLDALEAARLAGAVALGLAALHRGGLVHRDVKPDNVVLDGRGRPRVIDLGIAKDELRSTQTRSGLFMGTAPYVAPELWEGGRATIGSDAFGLGATLYELVSGRAPFAGADLGEVGEAIADGDYPAPRELRPGLPADLELVIARALEPEPARRYARMEALAADLDALAHGEPPAAPALTPPDGPRRVLLPGRWFTVGADPEHAAVVVADPAAAPEHAQLRRAAAGYVLHAFPPGPTRAGPAGAEEDVAGPLALRDGARIVVGTTPLAFADPLAPPDPAWPGGATTAALPAPVLEALAAAGDRRVAAWLLERLAPDPGAAAAARAALAPVVGPATAEAAAAGVLEAAPAARPAVRRALAGLGARPVGDPEDPRAWLVGWELARRRAPPQLGAAGPGAAARLGDAADPALGLDLAGRHQVTLGRDPARELTLPDRTVSRWHATALRLDRRWVVRDEGTRYGTKLGGERIGVAWLDPDVDLKLGDRVLRLRPPPAGAPSAAAHDALAALGHPAAAAGLLAALEAAARPAALPAPARSGDPARDAALAERLGEALARRATRARATLARLLGRDAGPDPAAWRPLLAARRAELGPQAPA